MRLSNITAPERDGWPNPGIGTLEDSLAVHANQLRLLVTGPDTSSVLGSTPMSSGPDRSDTSCVAQRHEREAAVWPGGACSARVLPRLEVCMQR